MLSRNEFRLNIRNDFVRRTVALLVALIYFPSALVFLSFFWVWGSLAGLCKSAAYFVLCAAHLTLGLIHDNWRNEA